MINIENDAHFLYVSKLHEKTNMLEERNISMLILSSSGIRVKRQTSNLREDPEIGSVIIG